MHRAGFSNESGPELVEDCIHRQQDAPEFLYRCAIIGRMYPILIEGNWIGDFDRHSPDLDVDIRRSKHLLEFLEELGHGAWRKRERLNESVIRFQHKLMLYEVKPKF